MCINCNRLQLVTYQIILWKIKKSYAVTKLLYIFVVQQTKRDMKNLILNNPFLSEIVLSDFPDHTIIYGANGDFQLMYQTSTGRISWTEETKRQHIQDQITMLIDANQLTDSDI